MDRVIAYNIVLAHIPGKANAAADILWRMQTDPNESLELQLVGSIPMQQREIDKKAKTPDASMLAIESVQEVEAKPVVSKNLIEKFNLTMRYNIWFRIWTKHWNQHRMIENPTFTL